jgi:hypothetical protein
MSGAPRSAFCREPFSRQRPAGQISMTLPVDLQTQMVTITTRVCMACVRRMMGESVDRAIAELMTGTRPPGAGGHDDRRRDVRATTKELSPANKGATGGPGTEGLPVATAPQNRGL